MITQEDYSELFYRIMGGQMSEMRDAMQSGRMPEVMDFRELVGTLWTVCQPDITVVKLDVSDRVKQLPGSDNVVSSQLFFAYRTESKELMVMYLDGFNDGDSKPPSWFGLHLTDMIRPILLDEYGLDPVQVNEMLADEAHQSGMDRAFNETLTAEQEAEIDQKVAEWREEINTSIDNIFKHGGG